MKNFILLFFTLFSFFQITLAQESNKVSDEVNITVIRKGSFIGAANKWQVWLNGEEFCKLKNSSHCQTSIKSDSLCLLGKVKGPAEINLIHVLSENPQMFCTANLDKPEYFFRAVQGPKSIEFQMIEKKEAEQLLKKAQKKVN